MPTTGWHTSQPANMKLTRQPFNYTSFSVIVFISILVNSCSNEKESAASQPGVAVLLVDTDRKTRIIEEDIYGQFLEHINHSVEDGLFAEQIQGQGFEAKDYETYWKPVEGNGTIKVVPTQFQKGEKAFNWRPITEVREFARDVFTCREKKNTGVRSGSNLYLGQCRSHCASSIQPVRTLLNCR